MTRKTYITVAALIASATVVATTTAAYGQEDLNRRVDVSKDYAPRVERAAKLSVEPQTGDTVMLRPDLDYTVRPRAWTSGFGVAPIRAAQMNRGTYNPQYPLYLKIGGGFPGQTLLDFHATSTSPGASGFGFYANHRAQFADLENYYGVKQSARSTVNSVGAFGKAVFGRLNRLGVAGELGFDYDIWSDYGVFDYNTSDGSSSKIDDIRMQHYATPRAAIVFGNEFTDLSFLNFRIGGDIYRMEDRADDTETGVRAFAEAGKQFGIHRLIFGAGMESYRGSPQNIWAAEPEKYGNDIVSVRADYQLVYEKVTFGMGARFAFESPAGQYAPDDKTWFLPQVELKVAASDEFNPYARIVSGIEPNSYRNIAAANPYLLRSSYEMISAKVTYEARAGFNGTLGGTFSYNIYAGGGIVKNDIVSSTLLWREDINPRIYSYSSHAQIDKKRKTLFAGAEFEAKLGSGFAVTVAGRYDRHDSDLYDEVKYLPKFTASMGISYNRSDKWRLRAGIEARGEYEFAASANEFYINPLYFFQATIDNSRSAPTAVNVTLGADYFLSERLGLFLEGANLANQKLYPLPFYPGVGVNVTAGVKLRF